MVGLKSRIQNLKSNTFSKGVLLISSGTVLAQVVGVILSPIITRIYSPSEYGVLSIYSAVLAILAFGTFKYELGIPIAQNNKNAVSLVALCIIILTTYVGLISILLLVAGNSILNLFGSQELFQFRFLIPLGIFLTGLFLILKQWAFREKNYKNISKASINQSIVGNLSKIGLGLIGWGPMGLVIGRILTSSMGIITLSRTLIRERNLWKGINLESILWNAKRYIKFPIFQTPTVFLMNAGEHLPIIFLTSLFGVSVAGSYGLAISIVMLPMKLIGDSIGDVFYGEAAGIGKHNPQKIKTLSKKILKRLILLGLIPLVILALFGPLLFSMVFGENWGEAGIYARILSLLLFFRIIFTPISRIFEIFEKQKEKLILNIIRTILIVVVFSTAMVFETNSYWVILFYSLVMSFVYYLNYFVAQKIIDQEIKKQNH